MTDPDVDEIIMKLRDFEEIKNNEELLSYSEVDFLIAKTIEILKDQPTLIEVEAPIKIVGNIHGHYSDLLKIFELEGFPPDSKYLFLGNYVNNGEHSFECICLLIAYITKYPENIFLLRGNHEFAITTLSDGFYDEVYDRYSIELWRRFIELFDIMPIAAVIENRIFCAKGGLSPKLTSLDQIRDIPRPK